MSDIGRPKSSYNPREQAAAVLAGAAEKRQRIAAETDPDQRSRDIELHYWTILAVRRINKDIAEGDLWQAAISAGGKERQDASRQETQQTRQPRQ
jgi:hypothetical protein|nr:hypothetical protein [uncultured Rhodopila sp.]